MGRSRNRKRKQQELVNVDWTDLPRGILEIIFEKLPLSDCISVGTVCRPWRYVVAQELAGWQSRGIPLLMKSGQKDMEVRTCVSILQKQDWALRLREGDGRYFWGSYQDWLFLVKDLGSFSIEISLFNPFSKKKIDLPSTWNLYHKMVLSGLPSAENFICMLVHSQRREVAFWVRGAQSWIKHKVDGKPFEDAVFSNGSFYLASSDYNIWRIEAANIFAASEADEVYEMKIDCHEVIMPEEHGDSSLLKYLVESCGEILLVCRFYSTRADAILETNDFKVYSLDFSQMSWKRVQDLRDQILFLGRCCSRSLSSKELGVEVTSRIYFSNDHVTPWWNEWDSNHLFQISTGDNVGRRDWGMFRVSNDNGGNFRFRGNRDSWPPIWFTAPQWWCCKNLAIG